MILTEEKGSTKKGICPFPLYSPQIPTWRGLGLNLYKEEFMRYEYLYEWWDG